MFKFYKKQLAAHSAAFAGAEAFPHLAEDVVDLTETSDVLDILLQFMSCQKQPSIASLDFTTLRSLAEATEKYQVFSAMTAVDMSMKYVHLFLLYPNI